MLSYSCCLTFGYNLASKPPEQNAVPVKEENVMFIGYARVSTLDQNLGLQKDALKQAGLGVYLLKPSLRELAYLTGRAISNDRDEEAAARQVIGEGRAEIVVLSLGARGALLVERQESERFSAIPVQERSTVGADARPLRRPP